MRRALTLLLLSSAIFIRADIEPIPLHAGDILTNDLIGYSVQDAVTIGTQLADWKAKAANEIDLYKIIAIQGGQITHWKVKAGLCVAGGVASLAGASLLLTGDPGLRKWGAAIGATGIVLISIGVGF